MKVRKVLKGKRLSIIFLIIGGVAGFLYWKYVGCLSGTCTIKSVWYWSTLWGAAMGYVVGDIINDIITKIRKRRRGNDDS